MNVLVLNPPSKNTKNVVRDLIYGCWCNGKRIGGAKIPPINLAYVATIIKNEGHEVYFFDALAEAATIEDVNNIIQKYDIVVISTSMMSFREDVSLLSELKKENKNLKSVIFGSHSTFMPNFCLNEDAVDVVVMSEPEYIIRDLINSMDKDDSSWKNVQGIGYREKDKQIINEPYPFIENLDELPFVDRSMLPDGIDYFHPLIKRMPYTTIMTSRGCPAKCNFCTVGRFYGRKTRYRSAENVLNELEMIQKQGYKEVFIRDETFTVYKERNKIICEEMIRRKIDLTWIANARVGTIDRDMATLMKKAGCHTIKFGVESGVQQILNNIKKGINVEKTRETFKMLNEIGLNTHAHLMLGCPGESKETIQKTIEFVKEIKPTTATFAIYTLYPGTEIFDKLSSEHPEINDGSYCDLSKVHKSGFFNKYFTELSEVDLEKFLKLAYINYYMRPSYIFDWIKRINDKNDLKRVLLAGSNVLSFSIGNE
jgi:anaerobic magnesium-protoporphyrin IX monomethyl ester cyclase